MDLPFIDEHRVTVRAPADEVWQTLSRRFARRPSTMSSLYARLVGAEPPGSPEQPPGFAVAESVPGERLLLTGSHRFSRYALEWLIEGGPDGTSVAARTYAVFPGVHGRAYRLLVIDSGLHGIVVRRMLAALR